LHDDSLGAIVESLFNDIRATGKAEERLKEVLQVPIPKKGDLSDVKCWRPICMVNTVTKLLNRVVFDRIVNNVDKRLRPNQYGSRPGRSTAGAQITLSEILAKARQAAEGISLGFVDFSKAFPSISFCAIREALRAFGIPDGLTRVIMSLYDGTKAFVRSPFRDKELFDILTGTLQWDVLAPFVFIMVLDRVLNKALDEQPGGITIVRGNGTSTRSDTFGAFLTDINYADDLAILAKSTEQLEHMLRRIQAAAREVNLQVNVGPTKTAWMSVGHIVELGRDVQLADGEVVPRVDTYRYLGQALQHDGKVAHEDRVRLAWYALQKMSPIWELPVPPMTKLRVFDSVVLPVLTYGDGSWCLTEGDLHKLDVTVSRMRRVACRMSRHTSLKSIYATSLRASTLHKRVRMRHIGHLLRGGDRTCYAYAVLWDPWGKNRVRTRARTPLELCADDLGLESGAHLFDIAMDRQRWSQYEELLVQRLEPATRCTLVTDSGWNAACMDVVSLKGLQFVEEGRSPFQHVGGGAIHAYTDGSLITSDGGHGAGYAACITGDNFHKIVVQPLLDDKDMTNNRAEFMAVIAACRETEHTGRPLVVHTDSLIVWNYFHSLRHKAYMSNYEGHANADLLRIFDRYIHRFDHNLYIVKVRSHNGNFRNDEADAYAGLASQSSFHSRHPDCVLNTHTADVIAHPAALPTPKQGSKEAGAEFVRSTRIKVPRRKDIAVCKRVDMQTWIRDRTHGDAVSIRWFHQSEPDDIFVSRGTVVVEGRHRKIQYDEWGLLPFPPIDDVNVLDYLIVDALKA
jgi:ribonuclease HI